MTHEFLVQQKLPFTAYDLDYIWENGDPDSVLLRVDIHPLTVTEHMISPGGTWGSISVRYHDGSKASASVSMYFGTIEDAQAEAAEAMAEAAANPPYRVLQARLAALEGKLPNGMRKFTVLVLYPEHVTDNFGTDTYMATVEARTVLEAQTMAQSEAYVAAMSPDERDDLEDNPPVGDEHLDYEVIMVIHGEHNDIKEPT
jgi:hypothetical protein